MCGYEKSYKNSFKNPVDERVDGSTTATDGNTFKVLRSDQYQPTKPQRKEDETVKGDGVEIEEVEEFEPEPLRYIGGDPGFEF